MSSSGHRSTDSNASDGATWLGGPVPNQSARRSGSVPHKPKVASKPLETRPGPQPAATFGEATTIALSDLFRDELARWLLKLTLTVVVAAVFVNHFTPECREPCTPAPLPSKANRAMTTSFDWASALQPTPPASQAHHNNIISAVKDYGIKAADYGVKAADHGVKRGMEQGAKYGANIAAAAVPGLWNDFWPGGKSGQYEHTLDPHRTRAWDLVIKKGENLTTFISLLSDLDGLSGTLYREVVDQYTRLSSSMYPDRSSVLDIIGRLQVQQSAMMGKLNEYVSIRKRAADALSVHRHHDSDEQQLRASVNDLNTLRTAVTEVGSDLFTHFHAAEKQIGVILKIAESLPWQKEKDTWFGGYKHRSVIAAVGRLRQFDTCIKTIRGMITSDIHVLG